MIIGFVGKAGSGKTTAAEHLRRSRGYWIHSFASPLKTAAAAMFNFTQTQIHTQKGKEEIDPRWGIPPRAALQHLGQYARDTFGEDFWIKRALIGLDIHAADVVFDDVRFINEAAAIRSKGGVVVRIRRPCAGLEGYLALDVSETEGDEIEVDFEIYNTGDLDNLRDRIDQLMAMIEGGNR